MSKPQGISLVREAGGFGDVMCCGAAAWGLRRQLPNDVPIRLFVPDDFVETALHLDGVDEVVSLGKVDDIRDQRRPRDAEIELDRYPCLKVLADYEPSVKVSLFCPGFAYESTCPGPLRYNRAQLFSMAAGVRRIDDARPRWKRHPNDEQGKVSTWFKKNVLGYNLPVVIFQPRGTCSCRSLTAAMQQDILDEITKFAVVLYIDCIHPTHALPGLCIPVINWSISDLACLVSLCDLALTVDSLLLHLSAALNIRALGLFGPTDGINMVQTYPWALVAQGQSPQCPVPCHYNHEKNWSRECRQRGCPRMENHSHNILTIVLAVEALLYSVKVPDRGWPKEVEVYGKEI